HPHRDVDRLDVDDIVDSVFREPVEKPVRCTCVSLAGVPDPDLSGEDELYSVKLHATQNV
ncbi:MAG: hypothetical protein OXP28_17820, partial [Gammaproteobacteria bacterium]|nr:hypothetical protein [Gammaproteobacteria bacterium]